MVGKTKLAVVLLILATAVVAADPAEVIDARARGTSTQMGKEFTLKIIINQYSTPGDKQKLVQAFQSGGSEALARTLFEMKSIGRIQFRNNIGYALAYAQLIPTPTGRKVRFVTSRKIALAELAQNTRSESYDLTAGEIDINQQNQNKSAGVLYPAAQLGINEDGQLQFNLYQNPWQLVNITAWPSKAKS